jgi:hypothetical protein
MVEPTQHSNDVTARSGENLIVSPSQNAAVGQPSTPHVGHTVGRPAQIPSVSFGRLGLWIGLPILFTVLIASLFWLLPALQSNSEDKDHPRIVGGSESQPESQPK